MSIGQAAHDEMQLAALDLAETLTAMSTGDGAPFADVVNAVSAAHFVMLNAALRAIDRLEERIEDLQAGR